MSVLPLSITTWNLQLLIYTGATDLLSRLQLGPSGHARVGNITSDVSWLEVLEQQTFEKCPLHPHFKHSVSFAGNFNRGCDGLLQFQHVHAVVLDCCLAVIKLTDVS